jgi:hypothetical protein
MLRIIEILFDRLGRAHAGRAASAADRRVRPRLESLEGRLVPSTSPLLHTGQHAPALVAAMPHADGTGGEGIALPDDVHGYKWRRRRPWESGGTTVTQIEVERMAAHLALGGQDGTALVVNGASHLVVRPPEGPLPIDRVF